MNENKTIVVDGKTIPATTVVDGRSATRLEPGKTVDIYSLFHDEYKGPFYPTDDDGSALLPLIGKEEVDGTKLTVVFDGINHPDGRVLDSNGKLVAKTSTWQAARMVSVALNKQPYSCLDGLRTGLSPFHGLSKHEDDNKFGFWCIQVPMVDAEHFNEPNALVLRHNYVSPFFYRWDEPMLGRNPMQAIRFRTKKGASKLLEDIRKTIASDPKIIARVEERINRHLKQKAQEGLIALARPNWDAAVPVRVNFSYNVIS